MAAGDWLAVDGKSIKGTVEQPNSPYQNFVNLVSVYSQRQGVVAAHILHLATGSRDYANPPYPPSEEGGQKLLCLHTQNPPTPF
jgi:hypothetical protein